MNLSIIIVNYRSWECLAKCLEKLCQEAAGEAWEIIVVDNHSADGKLQRFSARFAQVRFDEAPRNGGFAYGCNRGASLARGDILLFLNPDVIPETGSVRQLVDLKRRHADVAILSSSQVDGRGRWRKVFDVFPNRMTWFRTAKFFLRLLRPGRYPDPRKPFTGLLDCDWVSGSVFLIGRREFQQLGGWREDYWMYVEDCDLCLRAQRAGMRVVLSGDVRMMHAHGGASRQTFEISVLTRTEAAISKHLFVHLNYRGLNRWVNHLCVVLATVPKLALFTLLDLLTLRQTPMLRTRSKVFMGLMAHYARVVRSGDWHSRQVALRASADESPAC
ncbi:MAG: glycosyltransferase family 2 protein [Xanthomonadales bacterium]|nr:glycosyltransferase family 2 protein [Xanthomonadales bacterium]